MDIDDNTTGMEESTLGTDWPSQLDFIPELTTLFFTNETTTAVLPTTNTTVSNGSFPVHQITSYPENSSSRNNSLQPDDSALLLLESGLWVLAVRAVFLAVFIIVGFISNCMLLITLAQGNKRKTSYLNIFIINIVTSDLVDCTLNLPLVLGATITERWDYGDELCQLNACLFKLTSITTAGGLCILLLDRCFAVRSPARYLYVLSLTKVNLLIICSWVYGVALSFAPMAGLIRVAVYPARYLCSVGVGSPLIYVCLVPLLGYIIPLIVIIGFSSAIVHISRKQRKGQSEKKKKRHFQNKIIINDNLRKEINTSKYVGLIILIWIILEGPYVILNSVEQILNSSTLKSTSISRSFIYPWEMEVAFTWMRFSFPMFLPIVTFAWRRDVWRKFKNLMCQKANPANGNSPDGRAEEMNSISGGSDTIGSKKEQQPLAFNIPVLYANEQGIHVQTLSKRNKSTRSHISPEHFEEVRDVYRPGDMDKTNGIITARKCDVNSSQDLLQIDDDTSDYDSNTETDALGVSNHGLTGEPDNNPNPEIILNPSSDKSFKNEAYVDENPPSSAGTPTTPHTAYNSPAVRNEHRKHMRHSSDSGRGSEEGTVFQEKTLRPSIHSQDPLTVANFTTKETSTDTPQGKGNTEREHGGDKGRVKRRRRHKKKQGPEDPYCMENEEKTHQVAAAQTDQTALQYVDTRPPIRLKPINASSLSSSHSPAPARQVKNLLSPYRYAGNGGGTGDQDPEKERNLLKVKESDGLQFHNLSPSNISAITDHGAIDVGVAPIPANITARRRRKNSNIKMVMPDRLGQSDISEGIRSVEYQVIGDTQSISNSAADLTQLSQTSNQDRRKLQRPSPKPRKPRRVSDMPKSESEHFKSDYGSTC